MLVSSSSTVELLKPASTSLGGATSVSQSFQFVIKSSFSVVRRRWKLGRWLCLKSITLTKAVWYNKREMEGGAQDIAGRKPVICGLCPSYVDQSRLGPCRGSDCAAMATSEAVRGGLFLTLSRRRRRQTPANLPLSRRTSVIRLAHRYDVRSGPAGLWAHHPSLLHAGNDRWRKPLYLSITERKLARSELRRIGSRGLHSAYNGILLTLFDIGWNMWCRPTFTLHYSEKKTTTAAGRQIAIDHCRQLDRTAHFNGTLLRRLGG